MAKKPDKLILVTDDEPEIVDQLCETLTRIGYRTIKAYNGLECIEAARINKPDLLFLDIKMEHLDGWGVAGAMKKDGELKDIPIIMVTGKDLTVNDIIERAQLIENYIKKPITMKVIDEAIKDVFTARSKRASVMKMALKSGVEKETNAEATGRYMRTFNQYRTMNKLYRLYSQVNGGERSENIAMVTLSLQKGAEQLRRQLDDMEKTFFDS